MNVTSTSVTLAWNKVQQKQGGTSFIGYTVEYFSSDLQSGWVTAAQRVPNNVVTVCTATLCVRSQYSDLDLLIDIYRPLSNLHEIVNKLHMQGEQKL